MPKENWIPYPTMAYSSRGYIVEIDSNSDRARHAKVTWEGYREDEWKMGLPPPALLRPPSHNKLNPPKK